MVVSLLQVLTMPVIWFNRICQLHNTVKRNISKKPIYFFKCCSSFTDQPYFSRFVRSSWYSMELAYLRQCTSINWRWLWFSPISYVLWHYCLSRLLESHKKCSFKKNRVLVPRKATKHNSVLVTCKQAKLNKKLNY